MEFPGFRNTPKEATFGDFEHENPLHSTQFMDCPENWANVDDIYKRAKLCKFYLIRFVHHSPSVRLWISERV